MKTRICNAGKGRHDERKATVEWETRQLGIMDWITNDVDWMTGEWHPHAEASHGITDRKIDSKYKSKYKRATLWNYETNISGGCSSCFA